MTYQEQRAKDLAEVVRGTGLTSEQVEYITDTMIRTWNYIAADWLAMYKGNRAPRNSVVEGVTDASRMEALGTPIISSRSAPEERKAMLQKHKEMCELYYHLDEKKQSLIDRYAFPCHWYCD